MLSSIEGMGAKLGEGMRAIDFQTKCRTDIQPNEIVSLHCLDSLGDATTVAYLRLGLLAKAAKAF